MEFSATIAFWLVRATGLGMAVLGLLTWNGTSAVAGWRLFALGGPPRVATTFIAQRAGQGGASI